MKMKMMIGAACLGALLTACGGASKPEAPPPPPVNPVLTGPALQTEVERIRAANGLPGLTVVIVQNGQIEAVTAGKRRADGAAAIASTDQFQLGSLTKAASAMLIARLVEQKKLRWDSTLSELFPDWHAGMHPSLRTVTVEQILHHRAGFKRDIDEADAVILRPLATGNVKLDRATAARNLLQQAPAFTPDSRFHYSNVGYMLAGLIAEHAGGDSYETLMEKDVFGPLQMKAAFGIPEDAGLAALSGHELSGKNWMPAAYYAEQRQALALYIPAGGLMVSMADYGKYLKEHLQGLQGKSSFLSEATFRRIHTPIDNYGLGWMIHTEPGLGAVSIHDGSFQTYFAITALIPSKNRAVAVVCNCWSPAAVTAVEDFAERLAKAGSN
ncbi:MAG: serine hydrolase domain-containing protein [Pseudomonadota bacterium]